MSDFQTATNPETGEKIANINGEWVPIQATATNPQTGEKMYQKNGEWNKVEAARDSGNKPAATDGNPILNKVNLTTNSANKAIAGTIDSFLDAPNKLMNLGRAAFGTAATALGRSDLAPELVPDNNYAQNAFKKAGFIDEKNDPHTIGEKIYDTAIQGAVSMAGLSPANSVRQAASNAALGTISGTASGATKEATGNDALAISAGMLAIPGATNGAKTRIQSLKDSKESNAVRDTSIDDAGSAGYSISPTETNPGLVNSTLEGVAGKLSTRQLASQKNQDVTNSLARKAVGLPENTPLTTEAMQAVRGAAYDAGYKPLSSLGKIQTGQKYNQALDNLEANYAGAAKSFPNAVSDEVKNAIDGLRVKNFDSDDALKMAQILRDDASASYAAGNNALGKAQKGAANAIESQIEDHLILQGKSASEILQNFRDARVLMAKTHTIESAIKEGTGNVDASKIAALLQKGKPLTNELKTIGQTANVFPKNMQSPEKIGAIPGISPLDVMGGVSLGAMTAAATGNPLGFTAAVLPAVRPLVRAGILSAPYQKMMGKKGYDPSKFDRALSAIEIQKQNSLSNKTAAIQNSVSLTNQRRQQEMGRINEMRNSRIQAMRDLSAATSINEAIEATQRSIAD